MREWVKVIALVKEYEEEEKKTVKVPHYYKRHGKMIERSYPDYIYTDRYKELIDLIDDEKVFCCSDCGEKVSYFELETYCCDFEKGKFLCSCCYESEMGEDL